MGYTIPLKFLRVSDSVSVCATRVVAMMSTKCYQARRLIRDEKRAGTLLNAAGRDKVKTAIVLDNGTVVASPMSLGWLMYGVENSNAKHTDSKKLALRGGMKAFEVFTSDPETDGISDYVNLDDLEDEEDEDAENMDETDEEDDPEILFDEDDEDENEEEDEE